MKRNGDEERIWEKDGGVKRDRGGCDKLK